MKKIAILTGINAVAGYLFTPAVVSNFVISGYKIETVVVVFISLIVGVIITVLHPINKAAYFLALGTFTVITFLCYYEIIDSADYISRIAAIACLLLLFASLLAFVYLLTYFELWIVNLFKKEASD